MVEKQTLVMPSAETDTLGKLSEIDKYDLGGKLTRSDPFGTVQGGLLNTEMVEMLTLA